MVDAMAAIAAASSGMDMVKRLWDASKSMKNAEITMALAELMGKLADIKAQVAALQDENRELRQARDLRERSVFRDNMLFIDSPPTGYHAGPYCPRCWEETDRLISLQDYRNASTPNYYCLSCKNSYRVFQ